MPTESDIILKVRVGSHAYGLNHADSDEDFLGVWEEHPIKFLGINPKECDSVVSKDPDTTYHELGKAMRLWLVCNPTATELLWFDEDDYLVLSDVGKSLRQLRYSFLSAPYVRNAYYGYATGQFKRLSERGNGTFSSDTQHRTAKHARHLARLLKQGYELYSTGELTIRLDPSVASQFRQFGDEVADGNVDAAKELLDIYETMFNNTLSCLPNEPARETAQQWLTVRRLNRLTRGI